MSPTNSNECVVLGFYGLNVNPAGMSRYYQELLQWFGHLCFQPEILAVHGNGFSGKPGAFKRVDLRLRKQGFAKIDGVELVSMSHGGTIPVRDWNVTADILVSESYAVVGASTSIASFDDDMTRIARTIIEELKPEYGIGFLRERQLGPAMFAVGLNYGTEHVFSGPEYDEKVRISSWSDGMGNRVYREGYLRDVYPYNFLTKPQLSRTVKGVSLQEWINQDASRGRLSTFHRDVSLWSLEEAAIPPVRDTLREADVIFDAIRYANTHGEEEKDPYVAAVALMNPIPCLKCDRGADLDSVRVPKGQDRIIYLASALKKDGWHITFERGLTMICPQCVQLATVNGMAAKD